MYKKNKGAQFFLLAAVIISLVVISLGATTNRVVTKEGNFQEIDDFSYQVQKETGEVLNYEIYSGISDGKVEEFTQIMAEDIQDKDPDTEFVFVFGNNEGMTISNYGEEDIEVSLANLETAIYCSYLPGTGILLGPPNGITKEECSGSGDSSYYLSNCYACSTDYCKPSLLPEKCTNIGNSVVTIDGVIVDDYCIQNGGIKDCNDIISEPTTHDIPRTDLVGKDSVTVTIDGVDVVVPISKYKQVQLIVKRDSEGETYIDY